MKERVKVIKGNMPLILVAPHGADDINTDIMVETAAKASGCHAIINRGFERDTVVDVENDKADCNRVDHVQQDVVYDEFLRPLQKMVAQIRWKDIKGFTFKPDGWTVPLTVAANRMGNGDAGNTVTILYIHGCGNSVRTTAKRDVIAIVGYGAGRDSDSLTCAEWRRDLLIDLLTHTNSSSNNSVLKGKGGGAYAGRDSNNMVQYFRKHFMINGVHSMQIEYPFYMRNTKAGADLTGMDLAATVTDYVKHGDTPYDPVGAQIAAFI